MNLIDNQKWPLNTILVSRKHKVLYTPVAKNANTTLKRLFVRLSGHPKSREILHSGIHTYLTLNKTGLMLGDFLPEDATGILNDPEYFRFIVLREPLGRTVSGYLDKFVLHAPKPGASGEPLVVIKGAIDWVYGQRDEAPDYQQSISFNQFVNYLVQSRDIKLDTHFKSQESYFDRQHFDFMGTIENMSSVIEEMESRFGQKNNADLEFRNKIVSSKPLFSRRGLADMLPDQIRSLRKLPQASELLSDETKLQLNKRYQKDRELWLQAMA